MYRISFVVQFVCTSTWVCVCVWNLRKIMYIKKSHTPKWDKLLELIHVLDFVFYRLVIAAVDGRGRALRRICVGGRSIETLGGAIPLAPPAPFANV